MWELLGNKYYKNLDNFGSSNVRAIIHYSHRVSSTTWNIYLYSFSIHTGHRRTPKHITCIQKGMQFVIQEAHDIAKQRHIISYQNAYVHKYKKTYRYNHIYIIYRFMFKSKKPQTAWQSSLWSACVVCAGHHGPPYLKCKSWLCHSVRLFEDAALARRWIASAWIAS